MALSDAAGQAVGRVQYDPYGEVITSTLPITLTDRLFTGQRLDSSTGLYYYNARYYDPHLGRFIQPDTLVPDPLNPQAWNRFSYVYNNPLRYTDPSGHQGEVDSWLDPFRKPESWSWWDVAIMVFTFDLLALQDWDLGQPRGTTARWVEEQFEEVQAWQHRNIRDPMYARVPVLKTIDEIVESPEFQMGLMAAMMTANTFAPPKGDVVIRFVKESHYEQIARTNIMKIRDFQTFATTPEHLLSLRTNNPAVIARDLGMPAERAQYFVAIRREVLDQAGVVWSEQDWQIVWRFLESGLEEINLSGYIVDMGKTERLSEEFLRGLLGQ